MGRCKRTYNYDVGFFPADIEALVERTPEYDEESARKAVRNWWKTGYLKGGRLNLTVHLKALLTEDELLRAFNVGGTRMANTHKLFKNGLQRKPRASKPKFIIVQMVPSVMNISAKIAHKIKKTYKYQYGDGPVPSIHTIRRHVLRGVILRIYGLD